MCHPISVIEEAGQLQFTLSLLVSEAVVKGCATNIWATECVELNWSNVGKFLICGRIKAEDGAEGPAQGITRHDEAIIIAEFGPIVMQDIGDFVVLAGAPSCACANPPP